MSRTLKAFVLTLALLSPTRGNTCDFPLDTKVFDAKFSWTNNSLTDAVVLFSKVNPGSYEVKGVYQLASDGKYHFLRNYLAEWPTFAGNGETARVTHLHFSQGKYDCVLELSGAKNTDPNSFETYKAIFEEKPTGVNLIWPESENLLRFSPVTADQTVP